MLHSLSREEVDQTGEQQEGSESPIPPAVEKVAGDNDELVSPGQVLTQKIIQQEKDAQESQECCRVEIHLLSRSKKAISLLIATKKR